MLEINSNCNFKFRKFSFHQGLKIFSREAKNFFAQIFHLVNIDLKFSHEGGKSATKIFLRSAKIVTVALCHLSM
jgi:hypothetical protein